MATMKVSNAEVMRLQEEQILRRQNGTQPPVDDGRPPECFGKERPSLPTGVSEPDLSVCGREVAFLREQVAKHTTEPFPVKVLLNAKMLMALLYLRGPNRDPSATWVGRYMAMIERNSWMKTHQHMAFDTDGLLRDGLHRALAFHQSPEGERYGWIWFGVDPKAFAAMDAGRRRNAGENLSIDGDKHGNFSATVIRLRYRNEHNGKAPDDLLVTEIGQQLVGDPLFEEAVEVSYALSGKVKTNRSSAALAYWLIGSQSVRAARLGTFWNHLVKGAGLPEDSPIWACREKLIKMSNSSTFRHAQYSSQTAMTAWIIEAWNLWSNGNPVPSQKWPIWAHTHRLPAMDADDSYGTGESRRVIKHRERSQAGYKGRQRTPGNVVRALGIPRA